MEDAPIYSHSLGSSNCLMRMRPFLSLANQFDRFKSQLPVAETIHSSLYACNVFNTNMLLQEFVLACVDLGASSFRADDLHHGRNALNVPWHPGPSRKLMTDRYKEFLSSSIVLLLQNAQWHWQTSCSSWFLGLSAEKTLSHEHEVAAFKCTDILYNAWSVSLCLFCSRWKCWFEFVGRFTERQC